MAQIKESYRYKGVTFVAGVQWGDEGKGKIVDELAQQADIVVRSGGGPNAGHTVQNERGEFKLHVIPSGIFNPDCISVIADTVVVNPILLSQEITTLREKGVDVTPDNFALSENSHAIFEWHRKRDTLKEKARGDKRIGTTGQGIGPAYADRASREGLRVGDLLKPNFEELFDKELAWQERLTRLMSGEALLSELINSRSIARLAREAASNKPYDRDAILQELSDAREILAPLIRNVLPILTDANSKRKNILGEGAQGALLDIDLGLYPYVTSSNTGVPGFMKGTGIHNIDHVIGVTKAYSTRVGGGPLPTELHDETGEHLQTIGREVGTTTGRVRRVGWFDAVATRYGLRIAGVLEGDGKSSIALTKLDVLSGLSQIGICVGYEVDGHEYHELTTIRPEFVASAKPILEFLPGWDEDISRVRSYKILPANTRRYVERVQELLGVPVSMVSVGAGREETIYREAS